MPQVLKKEIQKRIISAALHIFYAKNFQSAKMKEIAKEAGIATGLLYSYFKNKNDLFVQCVKEAKNCIETLSRQEPDNEKTAANLFDSELPQLINYIDSYHKELVILADRSQGSPFAEFKETIISRVCEHMKKTPFLRTSGYDEILFHIISINLVEGFLEIARHYKNRNWAGKMVELLIKYHFYGAGAL